MSLFRETGVFQCSDVEPIPVHIFYPTVSSPKPKQRLSGVAEPVTQSLTMDFAKTKHTAIDPLGRKNLVNLEHHVHYLETEAYSSVLKAFIAQSDLLTWGKEGLMTELRKELNVTDAEHGEILTKINSNESVKWIREQRKLASHAEDYIKVNAPGYPSGVGNSAIKLKVPSSAAFYPQNNLTCNQSSLGAISVPSSMPPKFKDDRQTAELAMYSLGNAEQPRAMFNHNVAVPHIKGGGMVKVKSQLKKGFHASNIGNLKNRSDVIQIRATDRVIHDVKKMLFNGENPDPVVVEKAKLTLREQERAILEALDKLADVACREDPPRPSNQMQHYHVSEHNPGLGREAVVRGNFGGQGGRINVVRNSLGSMP